MVKVSWDHLPYFVCVETDRASDDRSAESAYGLKEKERRELKSGRVELTRLFRLPSTASPYSIFLRQQQK